MKRLAIALGSIAAVLLVTALISGSALIYAFIVGLVVNLAFPIDVWFQAKMFATYVGVFILLSAAIGVSVGVDVE